ncbi:MAG: glutamate--tRNA ligase [Clostridia bacterium]|nr:glutamate--tRNA ligase [Clostridia bacterium]
MNHDHVRTRFAPSPTGFMHVGNLRTALYEYLIARSAGGRFILRIEDTDQKRQVEGALQRIFQTLADVGLQHDEGPDVGGPYAPYVQSERLSLYPEYAQQLIDSGHAYRCFCSQERLENLRREQEASGQVGGGYDRRCRDLSPADIETRLAAGTPFVIRQKMPLTGQTTFTDAVFGQITVENSELEDQVLLKSDGYPTYNFANVIDDHTMAITHVVRGSEYLSSTPKYNLLYSAFGWQPPVYVHLPLIVGDDGRKLSKRHGAVSFSDLTAEGYLPEAIINYIALLGWSPPDNRELFTLEALCEHFSVNRISKSPSVFDYQKLAWFNGEYIRQMTPDTFLRFSEPWFSQVCGPLAPEPARLLAELLQPRVSRLSDIPDMIHFLAEAAPIDPELYVNKKSKSTLETTRQILPLALARLEALEHWTRDDLHALLTGMAEAMSVKNGQIMWPVRIAIARQAVTPGGAIEVLLLLGQEESLKRIRAVCRFLQSLPQAE